MKNNYTLLKSIAFLSLIFIFSMCKKETDSNQQKNRNMKDNVVALLGSFETGNESVAHEVINPNKYIQHNLTVGDGFEPFLSFLRVFGKDNPMKFDVKGVFQDGDHVFTYGRYTFKQDTFTGFDVFRFEDGKVVEHWDNLRVNPLDKVAPLSKLKDVEDLDKTEENKSLVNQFAKDVLLNKDLLNRFVSSTQTPNDKESLGKYSTLVDDFLAPYKSENQEFGPLAYHEVKKVLGEGNYVLLVSEAKLNGNPAAFYDLFRLDQGKIVEQLHVSEIIPDKGTWKNQNGKF